MLPRPYRLPKEEIALVFKTGKRFSYQNLLFIYTPSVLHQSRFCIIVRKGKKMTAAKRNRIKRILRSEITNRASQQQKPQLNMVIIFTTAQKETMKILVDKQLKEAFQKLLS